MLGVAGAIANAVADAVGARDRGLTSLPLSPERVWSDVAFKDRSRTEVAVNQNSWTV